MGGALRAAGWMAKGESMKTTDPNVIPSPADVRANAAALKRAPAVRDHDSIGGAVRPTRSQERYLNDARYHSVVDCMRRMLDENLIDIASLYEAAVEAANQHVMRTGTTFVIKTERP